MYNSMSQSDSLLQEFINTVPVIETHKHYTGIVKPTKNILAYISGDYYSSGFIATSNQAESEAESVCNIAMIEPREAIWHGTT